MDALDETIRRAQLSPAGRINVRVYPDTSPWDGFWSSFAQARTVVGRLEAISRVFDSETARAILGVFGDSRARGYEIRMEGPGIR